MPTEKISFTELESRRQELGLSQSVLAERCGVSLPTVQRILAGQGEAASLKNITAIARALGMELKAVPRVPAQKLLEQQAGKKAEQLVGLVQGSSALESQGLTREEIDHLIQKTAHELLAGSRRRLWAE